MHFLSRNPPRITLHTRTSSFYSKLLHVLREAGIVSPAKQSPMSPTLGPDLAPATSLGTYRPGPRPIRRSSTSSSRTTPDNGSLASVASSAAYSSSSLSIPYDNGVVDVVRVEGLRHAGLRLEAR
ncbi:hypothetical protein OH76DRAFT_602115 [Lentinus brumalis]|uniref:Uncharacterized protein n=1 Tax=Lentinus brumalis TaxID=2498619 RepID=A0A371DUE9_9APHY|nr:hypothetical protein OH76DRAFT_602115 [Polyporus brumalis]